MLIEIGAPASLPLGLVKLERDGELKTYILALTLQHPPAHLQAQKSRQFKIIGARAHIASAYATQFLKHHQLRRRIDCEIEVSIPAFVGLGADPMLGLTTARALAWLNDLPLSDTPSLAKALNLPSEHAYQVWGFHQGGLILVEVNPEADGYPQPLYRAEIEHHKSEAWAFVFVLPRVPYDTPDSYEADQLTTWLQAAPHLSPDSGTLVTQELFPAVEQNDLQTFGRSLIKLQRLNQEARQQANLPIGLSPPEYAILHTMRDTGASAWGKSLTGAALYGLVKGDRATIDLRNRLRKQLGPYAGTVMAAITDNTGARHVIKNENLHDKRMKPVRPREGVSGGG